MNKTVNDIIAATLGSEKDLKLHTYKYDFTSCEKSLRKKCMTKTLDPVWKI